MGCPANNPETPEPAARPWVVTLAVEPAEAELVGSRLWDVGTTGVAEVDGRLLAGFPDERTAREVAERVADWPAAVVSLEPVAWSGDDRVTTVTIRGSAEGSTAVGPARTLRITAGPTFGHGGHPTTALALDLLAELLVDEVERRLSTGRPGPRVLDVGTGSGVLAIAAASLGAEPVVGIDIDPAAPAVARANAAANGVAITCSTATATEASASIGDHPFDVVVANVLLVTQRALATELAAVLAPGGSLITAGYLVDDEPELVALHTGALTGAGCDEVAIGASRRLDGWAAHRFDVGPRVGRPRAEVP